MPGSSKATLIVKFTEQGFHCWPDANNRREYLRNLHRHLFHVEVRTAVSHDDREIEFHDLRDHALSIFRSLSPAQNNFGGKSCEQIAREMAVKLSAGHGCRPMTVVIMEDGEFGAEVTEVFNARA